MNNINSITLTKTQARQFILTYQHLLPPRQLKQKSDIVNYIKKVGCIQFDPLNKVGKNPHLVLQSRFNNYQPNFLEELLYKDRKLIDGWDKNMSIYPVEDWPYFSRYRDRAYKRYRDKSELLNKIIPRVKKIIEKKGPISSIDLDFDKKVDWSWAPTRVARAALEYMYARGELIIHHKVGTRKVYDLAKNHLPGTILKQDNPLQTMEEYHIWYVKRRVGSLGMLWSLSGSAWLGIDRLKKKERMEAINQLLKKGELLPVKIKKLNNLFYIRKEDFDLLEEVLNKTNFPREVSFIAPLDNLLWDRKLIKRIFNFDYVWEVYKPASERKYGYYVLPVLYGHNFIGRFEPVFNKEKGELIIKNWWWEENFEITSDFKKALTTSFHQFLYYLGGNKIKLNNDENSLQRLSWLSDMEVTTVN